MEHVSKVIGVAAFCFILLFSSVFTSQAEIAEIKVDLSGEQWQCYDDSTFDPCHIGLTGVDMLSSNEGWAVGYKGRISHWDGETWSIVQSPTTTDLNVVNIISTNDGWALGNDGKILHWNGIAWTLVNSPTSADFNSMSTVSSSNVWATANDGIYNWDGIVWKKVVTPNTLSRSISMVPGSNGTDGWAVGWYGTILHWNGSDWTEHESPTSEYLTDVQMLSSTEGWAISHYHNLVLRWDGDEWTQVAFPTYSANLFKLAAHSTNDVWIIGFSNGADVIYHWNGSDWILNYYSTDYLSLSDITISPETNGNNAWVVGENGSILWWNGTKWSIFNNPYTKYFLDVEMVSPNNGWAIGSGFPISPGTAYQWNGYSWIPFEMFDAFSADFFTSSEETIGWAGGVFGELHYWNGNTWEEKISPVQIDINDIEIISKDNVWAIGGGYDPESSYQIRGVILHYENDIWVVKTNPVPEKILSDLDMLDEASGWAVGQDGTILQYSGESWIEFSSPTSNALNSIKMINENSGWIVGANGTILNWDGNSWSIYTSPTSSDLQDLEILDNHGWAVGDTILNWNGDEWVVESNVPLFPTLYSITSMNPYEFWAVGKSGVIMHFGFSPTLTINYSEGAVGSYFNLTGTDFPPFETASIFINDIFVGSIEVDEYGAFSFTLSTEDANEGDYTVVVSVNPSASTTFMLDNDLDLRAKEGDLTTYLVPENIGFKRIYLPLLTK